MAVYTKAIVMRDAVLTVGGVSYANQVTKARLVPDTPIQTLRTLVPDGAIQDVDSTVWTFEMSGVQAMAPSGSAAGLAYLLNSLAGTSVEIVLQPKSGTGQDKATFSILALPVEFGGDQGAFRTFEATFPVSVPPVFAQS